MISQEVSLQVYEAGELTVVGFGGRDVPDDLNLAESREEILTLVQSHECRKLAVDLTGVTLIPSGLLGMLASLREMDIEVHLYNASDDVREVLSITRLDTILTLHEVDV